MTQSSSNIPLSHEDIYESRIIPDIILKLRKDEQLNQQLTLFSPEEIKKIVTQYTHAHPEQMEAILFGHQDIFNTVVINVKKAFQDEIKKILFSNDKLSDPILLAAPPLLFATACRSKNNLNDHPSLEPKSYFSNHSPAFSTKRNSAFNKSRPQKRKRIDKRHPSQFDFSAFFLPIQQPPTASLLNPDSNQDKFHTPSQKELPITFLHTKFIDGEPESFLDESLLPKKSHGL